MHVKIALLCMILLFCNSAFCQEAKTATPIDTANVAGLPGDEYVFNKPPTRLTFEETVLAEEIVKRAFSDNKIPFSGLIGCEAIAIVPFYKRQYFPVLENGEKQVYVNCFIDKKNEFPFWRKQTVIVFDSPGFVNLVINLTKKEYSSFSISKPAFRKMRAIKTTVTPSDL